MSQVKQMNQDMLKINGDIVTDVLTQQIAQLSRERAVLIAQNSELQRELNELKSKGSQKAAAK